MKKIGRNRPLKLGFAAVLIAAGTYTAYETIPVAHENINSFLNNFTDSRLVQTEDGNAIKPEALYDKNADKQIVIAGENARPISEDKALVLAKENPPRLHDGDFPTLPLVFIGKLAENGEATIETNYVEQAYNPITGKPDRLNTGKYITFTNAGTELALTLEEYEVFQVDPFIHEGESYFAGVVLRFNDPDGIQYTMSIMAPEDKRHLEAMEIIKNAPTVGENGKYFGSEDYEKIKDQEGLKIKGGVSIIRTTEDNTKVRIGASPILPQYPKSLPAEITFIDQDGQMVFPE